MKLDIFIYTNYKKFVKESLEQFPKKGRGQYKRMAEFLNTSTVAISQIFNGQRDLAPEHAYLLTKFFELDDFESSYFIQLVDYNKTSHFELKDFLKKRLDSIKGEASKHKARISKYKELQNSDKAIFYSHPDYSRVRLASSLEGVFTDKDLSEYLNIPLDKVQKILSFLVQCKLCIQNSDGSFDINNQHTLLTSDSPFVRNHHINWRTFSIQKASTLDNDREVMFSLPMSLSYDAYEQIHKLILKTIKDTYNIFGPTSDERLAYLGIDLYNIQ